MSKKFHVLKDTREKSKGWYFNESNSCSGTTESTLQTGDYTLRGLEEVFIVEKKSSTSEWARNVFEKRFFKELERLEEFVAPFIICEFTMDDILRFPYNSGIPKFKWKNLRITPEFLLKKTLEIQVKYKTKIILAGTSGYHIAWSLFKRAQEKYG